MVKFIDGCLIFLGASFISAFSMGVVFILWMMMQSILAGDVSNLSILGVILASSWVLTHIIIAYYPFDVILWGDDTVKGKVKTKQL